MCACDYNSLEKKPIFITFFGPPGAGKGTVGSSLKENYGIKVVSAGDLCRLIQGQDTDLGRLVSQTLASGKLLPDSIMADLVWNWVDNNLHGSKVFLIDGYPRTASQVESFFKGMEKRFLGATLVPVGFSISQEDVVSRLVSRRLCSNQECQAIYSTLDSDSLLQAGKCKKCSSLLVKRSDDVVDVIVNRYQLYVQSFTALITEYEKIGKNSLGIVDVTGKSKDFVLKEVVALLKTVGAL